jgi:hypothetical protein
MFAFNPVDFNVFEFTLKRTLQIQKIPALKTFPKSAPLIPSFTQPPKRIKRSATWN